MATKNLARTVIEGGRGRYNKFDRRYSNRQHRQRAREFSHRARFDEEMALTGDVPRRRQVWRQHRDRLAAAERWLASFIGTPWDEVRAEIARRFDTRTIAGQHIVFDHLLRSVDYGASQRFGYPDFQVDADGVLQKYTRPRWVSPRRLPAGKVRRSWTAIQGWAQGRRVGRRGAFWFWFEATAEAWVACSDRYCWRAHTSASGLRCHRDPATSYRQTLVMSTDEVLFWHELLEDVQKLLSWPMRS